MHASKKRDIPQKAKKTSNKQSYPKRPHQKTKVSPQKKDHFEIKNNTPFTRLELHPKLVDKLDSLKFQTATKVQAISIPMTLKGKNIFCSSETGSGKTLAFLLPMIHKFYLNEINQALIICPTREIAIQIQKTLLLFDDPSLSSTLVIGGTNLERQKQALKEYPKILVATPGRLLDMLKTGLIWLHYTEYVVLDEADRMLDMGFEEDLMKIHKELTGPHQTILFSATLFPEIKKMAARYAKTFEEIIIGKPTSVAKSVKHVVIRISENDKLMALQYLIKKNRGKSMVFFNTIKQTIQVTQTLKRKRETKIDCIHSKVDQPNRERLIEDFRANKIRSLFASDIAARGIDIPNVELVINFDIPNNAEEYIHRVGRTGRAGKAGLAVSFYTPKEAQKRTAIETLIKLKIPEESHYKKII